MVLIFLLGCGRSLPYGILSIEETIRFKGDDAMRKLEYTFKTDMLYKMLFVQYSF